MNKSILATAVIFLLCGCSDGGNNTNTTETDATLNDTGLNNDIDNGDAQASPGNIELADLSEEFDPEGVMINGCSAPYYRELSGAYDGQIAFQTAENACRWEVLLVITPTYDLSDDPFRQFCLVTGNYRSVQLSVSSGDMSNCRDIDIAGKLEEPYATPVNNHVLLDPSWPVTAEIPLATSLPAGDVYPLGKFSADADQVSVEFQFDGSGNATFSATSAETTDWDGVLVKR